METNLMNGGTGVSLSCYYSKTILFVPVFLMVKLMIAASYNSFFFLNETATAYNSLRTSLVSQKGKQYVV